MHRSKPDPDFDIHVDSPCLNTPMDEETSSMLSDVEKTDHDDFEYQHDDHEVEDAETEMGQQDLRPSIETDDEMDMTQRDQSYVDHSEPDAEPRRGDGDDSSSQREGTDEDVFTDKSPRSSMGSYDAGSESGKGADIDNMTTITHSPRISDISQYDKDEEFIPTVRGTPRPPFRTPSDVRAMQMSSPAGSVVGSPRSSRKHFPTVSRLGTPSASAQYSPKRKSTPPRFKSRQEAPLVLLHVTLLPLRWMWGDLVNNLDPAEMSEQVKTLRSSWRVLQDRVGDTVIERGILLGHPQNDYEVLEERLLEALDLPVRRRARILECGHYLGHSNESTFTEDEESGDDQSEHPRQSTSKRHWCATCKSDIRPDSLGDVKVFRVKIYASNGLMRAGAWEACWKEMERVDVELEPIVEPAVQDEIVRLAAVQQEREIAQQEEADFAKEATMQYEDRFRGEQAKTKSPVSPGPEVAAGERDEPTRESRASHRRQQDEERLREIYGRTPPPESRAREPSAHRLRDPHAPSPSQRSTSHGTKGSKEDRGSGYQSAGLAELILRSARVLVQDRKNVIILALSLFVLVLSLRRTPTEPPYEPIIHRLKAFPDMQRLSVVDTHPAAQEQQHFMEDDVVEPEFATPSFEALYNTPSQPPSQPSSVYEEEPSSFEELPLESPEPDSSSTDYQEASTSTEPPQASSVTSPTTSQIASDTVTASASVSTVYERCAYPVGSALFMNAQAGFALGNGVMVDEQEIVQEIEITTEKRVVKVVQTVTTTRTHTRVETQTELETATAEATIVIKASQVPEIEGPAGIENTQATEYNTVSPENRLPAANVRRPIPELTAGSEET